MSDRRTPPPKDETAVWDVVGRVDEATGDQDAARAAWCEALAILDELGRPEAGEVRAKLT